MHHQTFARFAEKRIDLNVLYDAFHYHAIELFFFSEIVFRTIDAENLSTKLDLSNFFHVKR